ncbi:MAG: ATP-binding protein [Alphaproteobacteria bacterium]
MAMFSSLNKLYRNTLFRLSLLGAVLFMGSILISLGYVYFATIETELRRVDRALESEVEALQILFNTSGAAAVDREVIIRSASNEGLYMFQTPNIVSGNLAFKEVERLDQEFSEIQNLAGGTFTKIKLTYSDLVSNEEDFQARRIRAIAGNFRSGDQAVAAIIVGRDVEVTMRTADRVVNAMISSSIIAMCLGLLSSWYVSRRFSRRVEDFNRLATDIRAGNLDRRVPRNYSEDEMDLLAEHLNAMLDHIDRLMKAMRYAGDSIAHDLRSPLTRLRTRLESAAVALKDDAAADTLFAAAGDADELLKTFDSVLRIARLEAGERRELLIDVDPKPLLDDIAELYEPACEDAGLSFKADIDPGLLVLADRGLISQGVSNLVENAIKYTPKGGTIILSLKRNKTNRVEVSITDDGPGIPESERQRVKERFVRLDKSRSEPGSGLGLALVDAIADLHRAEFELTDGIQSERGSGLSAKLIFPRRRRIKQALK